MILTDMSDPQTRLPQDTRIDAVHLQVADLSRSLAFYADLLGLRLVRSDGTDAWLSATGSEPHLLQLTERSGLRSPPPRATGLFHVAWRAPDRAALGRWLHRLLDTKTPLQGASDHGVSEALYLADPDGLGVELYADRPRDRWQYRGKFVAMGSEQLDTADLLAQAIEPTAEQWTGVDPDTDIGHVHLCVSSLERAESFYVNTLGFDATQRDFPGALFLAAGGYHHHLGTNTWRSGGAEPVPEDCPRLLSYTIGLPTIADLAAVRARLGHSTFDPGRESSDDSQALITHDGDEMQVIFHAGAL